MDVACVSSVYKKVFHEISEKWFLNNVKFLPGNTDFHLVSMDSQVNENLVKQLIYTFGETCIEKKSLGWGDGDLARLAKIKELNSDGTVCVHLDLDLALFRDISNIIQLPYDFIISRAFAFPEEVSRKIGFVGCTGFYVTKPKAMPLISCWFDLMKSFSFVDQEAINKILGELNWEEISFSIDGCMYNHSITTWNDISILVLGSDVLPRNPEDLSIDSYGLHNPCVISDMWRIKV